MRHRSTAICEDVLRLEGLGRREPKADGCCWLVNSRHTYKCSLLVTSYRIAGSDAFPKSLVANFSPKVRAGTSSVPAAIEEQDYLFSWQRHFAVDHLHEFRESRIQAALTLSTPVPVLGRIAANVSRRCNESLQWRDIGRSGSNDRAAVGPPEPASLLPADGSGGSSWLCAPPIRLAPERSNSLGLSRDRPGVT